MISSPSLSLLRGQLKPALIILLVIKSRDHAIAAQERILMAFASQLAQALERVKPGNTRK
jgi:hypothetical protein